MVKNINDIFKNIELEGAFKDAHKEAVEELGLTEEEARIGETLAGVIQSITAVAKLPLEIENAQLKAEVKSLEEAFRHVEAKLNVLEREHKKTIIENNNLVNSLKAMKELSIVSDKIESSSIDPSFIRFVKENNTK